MLFSLQAGAFLMDQNNDQSEILQAPLSPADCSNSYERKQGYSIQRLLGRNGANCIIHVSPTDYSMIYRSFVFTSEGEFLVFNSYGNGNQAQTTGARVYFTFPRVHAAPTYDWNEELNELKITTVSGNVVTFDYKNSILKSFSDAELTISPEINPHNKGGVELSLKEGLILDAGFKRGGSPISNSKNSSSFVLKGKKCSFQNNQLFKYTESGDSIFKFDDEWLWPFLQERCPHLGI